MRKIFTFFLLLFFIHCKGQQCSDYYYFNNAAIIQFTNFSSSGEKTKDTFKISNVNKGFAITSIISNNVSTQKISCTGQEILITDKYKLDPNDKIIQIKEGFLKYPNVLKIGERLDGSISIQHLIRKGFESNSSKQVYDRKVIKKEKVSTPAGSWMAFCINYKMSMSMSFGLGSDQVNTFDCYEWFVPFFGIVKKEERFPNGSLFYSSILTKLN